MRILLCMLMGLIFASPVFAKTLEEAKIQHGADNIIINIVYPVLKNEKSREDVKRWVSLLAENFLTAYKDDVQTASLSFELLVTYKLTRPSDKILSIAWEVGSYTGGAHGNFEIITMTYDTTSGTLLDPLNLFDDPNTALVRMGKYTFAALSNTLGNMYIESMLRQGTEPILENFSSIALTPTGIRIYFQPYQVAPWAAGFQEVDMPLSALEDAKPQLDIWDKQR